MACIVPWYILQGGKCAIEQGFGEDFPAVGICHYWTVKADIPNPYSWSYGALATWEFG
jgi:hypothetical protein